MNILKESVNLGSLKFLFEVNNNEEDDDLPSGLNDISDKILKDFGSLRQFFVKAGMADVATDIGQAANEFKSKVGDEDDKKVVSAQIAGQMFIAAFSNLIVNLDSSFKKLNSEESEHKDLLTLKQIFEKSESSIPDDFKKYFEKHFIPSQKARKEYLNSWNELKKESLGNNRSVINEGFIDRIKSLFGGSGPKTASQLIAIVKKVLPKANASLQKFIDEFKRDPRVPQQIKYKQFRDGVKASLSFLKQQVAPTNEAPSNNEPPENGADNGDGGGPSPGEDENRGGRRGDPPDSTGGRVGGEGGSDKKSIKALLSLEDNTSKEVFKKVKDAKISVTGIGDILTPEQKQKLAAALSEIESEMQKKIGNSFKESRKKESDSLIIERWQHLAGIIK